MFAGPRHRTVILDARSSNDTELLSHFSEYDGYQLGSLLSSLAICSVLLYQHMILMAEKSCTMVVQSKRSKDVLPGPP